MQTSPEILINKGSVFIYRVFDIAEELDLAAVERILRQAQGQSRMSLARSTRRAIIIRNAPVRISLGPLDLKIGERVFKAEAYATAWDYGALSISFQVPIASGTSWNDVVSLSAILNGDMPGDEDINATARHKVEELSQILKGAMKHPELWHAFEDYAVYFLEDVQGISQATDLLERANVPALIMGEPKEILSEKCRSGILENVYQYATNDMVVIDWNSAVVFEPTGSRDIPDVLEFALTHLLEVRFYDDLLDRRLSDLYDMIEKRRSGIWGGRFSLISREANTRFIEFSEFIERVDNSLKVVGDFYLAVIFRGAMRRFRILDWQQSITRKMNLLARVSELLQGELNVFRGHTLEIIIILLIAYEIVYALIKGV